MLVYLWRRSELWDFFKITGQRKLPNNHWGVKVLWDTGEDIWEPINTIKEDDRLTLSAYARYIKLVDTPKFKWARCLTNNPKKFIRMFSIFSGQTKQHNTKYKYGVKVPRNFKEAIKFYHDSGNTLWQDATGK